MHFKCLTAAPHPLQDLGMPGSYYSVLLPAKWKLIVLDTTEMSLHSGYPEVGSSSVATSVRLQCTAVLP
jgi:hypothetical protein